MIKKYSLLLCVVMSLFVFTACGGEKAKMLDKEKAVENLDALTLQEEDGTYPLFSNLAEMDDTAAAVYNVDTSLFSDYTIKMPMINVRANLYVLARPVEGKEEEAKANLDAFMDSYEEQWERYLPDQYELVKARKVGEVGGYYVYLISADNDAAWRAVESALS